MTRGQSVNAMVTSCTDFSPLGEISWLISAWVSAVSRTAIQMKTGPAELCAWISHKMEQNSVQKGLSSKDCLRQAVLQLTV